MNDNKRKLYDALSEDYDLGTFEQFSADVDNEEKRRKLYDATSQDYDFGDYESFSKQLGVGEQKTNAPTPVENKPTPSLNTSASNNDYEGVSNDSPSSQPRRGFKAGMQESWKGLSAGTQFAFGEAANMITGSSRDDANALYEFDKMRREGKDIAAEVEGAWTDLGREIRTGLLEFLPRWAIKNYKERVLNEAERQKVLDDIRDALGEANGDVANARLKLVKKAKDKSFGDIQMEKAAEKIGDIKPTEGFAAWLGENVVQMIPSASALIVGALTKSPAAARAIGAIGMGGMTAATAGSSMYEAREAGASDLETRKVGVVDGAIEYITEKLPFDNYTNWMKGRAKSKVTQNLAKALRGNPVVREETENLLKLANEELGGALFSKKHLASYMADMAAEGLSEFTAEASQTMTRLIYDNPDLFPLLGEAVSNGAQGMLAGFFIGGVLGGASTTLQHHQNKQRRQDQGYVDVSVVNFGTKENPEYDVVEILNVSDDTPLAQVLRGDGEVVNVNKDAIGQGYRYSYAEFEAGRRKVLESEAIDNGTVTEGMAKAATERVHSTVDALVHPLREQGVTEEEIDDILYGAIVGKTRVFDSEELDNAYNAYKEAVAREREIKTALNKQKEAEKGLKRTEIEEKAGSFWRDNQSTNADGVVVFNPTVETGLLQDGTRVYILSDVNEQGECTAVTENGEKKIVKADMLQDGTQVLTLDEYLESLVQEDKRLAEAERMTAQSQERTNAVIAAAQPGVEVNLGTEEVPIIGTIVERTPDGFIVQSEQGASQLTIDEMSNALNIGSPVLTDTETADLEASEILGAEAAYNAELAQSVAQDEVVANEATAAEEEFKQADPLPLDAGGNVDETTLWNQDPARWAEWNDQQRGDNGTNSILAINSAMKTLSAQINKMQTTYNSMPVGKERNAMEAEIAKQNERLSKLVELQQKYVIPEETATTEQEVIVDNASAIEQATAAEEANSVVTTLRELYNDPELSEEEIEDYINANVTKAESDLAKHANKAPVMGTDMAKYKAERAKHAEKTAELEKQRDFWKEVRSYVETPTSEIDMEPQNALEFTAKELSRKDGVKLQRDSFARHTGYGSEAGNFLSLLRGKKKGGLTLEEAGERLMEMDRENNTGFFDQNDPNAGLNAILDVIGSAKTSGGVSNYIKAQREQVAKEEVAAARNAMMEEIVQPEQVAEAQPTEMVSELEEDLPEDIFPEQFVSSLDEDMSAFRAVSDQEAVSKATEIISGKADKFAEIKERAAKWGKRLGIKINVLEDINQVEDAVARDAINRGVSAPGWFDPKTGEVYIYAPHNPNLSEVDKTVIHEVISHKGLRGLLGKKGFDALCDATWKAMSMDPATVDAYIKYPGVLSKARLAEYNANPETFVLTEEESRKAADEFIAHRSESLNVNKSAWQKMIDNVKKMLRKITGKFTLGESLDELLEKSLERYEAIAKIDLKGVVEEGQTYQGIIDATTGAKIHPSGNVQAEGNVAFRNADGTLVGMHNISEDKLRKAIKMGGLANPSTAVVNIAEYSLEGFGDISLIMPSSLVDAEVGDNIGTYTGDAWTPTYPTISRQIDDAGWKIVKDRIRAAVGESDDLYHDIVNSVDNYLSDGRNSRLEFVFLKEKGIEPKIELKGADGFVGMRNLEAILGFEGLRDSMESYEKYKAASPMAKRSFNTWQRVDGDKKAHKALKEELRQHPEFAKLMKLNEDLSFAQFDSFTYNIFRKEYDAGNVNTIDTLGGASRYVDANDMRSEFEAWLDSLMQEAGAKEVFLAGWTRDGDRIYKDNTLENVSRHMRMQGRTNAYDDHGLSATKSALLQRLTSLAEIRKNRARLQDESSYNKSYDELKDRLFNIISQLADMEKISDNPFMNIDYAEARLQEAIVKRNPISYLNNEYGYSIDPKGEYAEELKSFIKDVQKMPAKYFETKFERPVYLNEFAAAVMPNNTSEDVKQAITEAGLPIFEYDSAVEGARREATLKATEEEGVRFRILGEMGAANLDAAEEATIRLDNLDVARQMEEAGKDAKTIKLATGWERGVDNLWRYEVPDEYNLADLEKRLQEELDNGAAKTWGIVYPSDLGQLLKEYPDFNVDIMVWVGDEFENTGAYSPAAEGDENTFGRSASIEVEAKTIADVAPLLAHEIQHAIQEMEGFAEGGQARGLNDKLPAELDKRVATIKQLREEGRNEEADELMQMSKGLAEAVINNDDDAYGNYKKLAGEVEARNAAKRIGKSLQERRESLLSETEDVAREDQIILIDGLNARAQFIPSLLNLRKAVNKIKSWMSNNTRNDSFEIALPNSVLRKIRSVMGRDFDSHNITANGLAHALKNHGVNGKKLSDTSIPIRKEDMELVPYIMTAPDRIEKGSTKNNRESVRFIKNISNGYIVVIEKELDNSMDDLETINMWAELSDVSNATRTLNSTSETSTIGRSDIAKIRKDAEDAILSEELKQKISQVSTAHNSLLNATSSALSADKGSNNLGESNTRFRVANENQAIFVSNAAKAVEGIKQEKATPEQWLKMIEKAGGLKAGEDKWMGLSDWLKASDKKTLAKDEVLQFINDNMIVIEEQHYSNSEMGRQSVKILNEKFPNWEEAFSFDWDGYMEEPYASIWDNEVAVGLYSNNHEDQIELDENGEFADFEAEEKVKEFGNELAEIYYGSESEARAIHGIREDYTSQGLTNLHEIALTVPTIEPWKADDITHFGDAGEGRAIAWIRFGDASKWSPEEREDGKKGRTRKVLVIDEIQSKRHQEGREQGYSMTKEDYQKRLDSLETEAGDRLKRRTELLRTLKEKYGEDFRSYLKLENTAYVPNESVMSPEEVQEWNATSQEEINDAIDALKKQKRAGVPDAPFDKNWHELAMKRMLRYAAENGYDVIAWTKGEQQADRYDIGGVISEIRATKYPRGYEVASFGKDRGTVHYEVFADESAMAGVYGKEMAQRIIEKVDALEPSETAKISGDNLRIGGEGMRGFYDKMLPAFMNKYGKKWGVKVEDINLPGLENGLTMHSVPVTEEMKASVMEGQVMFRVTDEAIELYEETLNEYRSKYNEVAPTSVVDIRSRKSLADALGVSEKELGWLRYFTTRLAVLRGLRGGYAADFDRIAIFADNSNMDRGSIESKIFHESIHKVTKDNPQLLELGKWMWDNLDTITANYAREAIKKDYDKAEYADEMVSCVVGTYMSIGKTQHFLSYLPEEHKANVELIFNTIGYESEREDRERDLRRQQRDDRGLVQEQSAGRQMEKESVENQQDTGTRLRVTEITPEVRDEMAVIAATALVNGNYMKAPNGADTNLTAEQWAMVRTKNFKAWFGDWENDPENASKVVDENGEPMVVYHGTGADFTKFVAWESDRGYYHWELAHFGTREQAEDVMRTSPGNKHIMEVFLNIRKPYRISDQEGGDEWRYAAKHAANGMFADQNGEKADGLIYLNEYEGKIPADSYAVWNPSQIKSATDNNGEFLNEDDDIRFRSYYSPTEQIVDEGLVLSIQEFADLAADIFAALPEESRKKITASLDGRFYDLQDAIMQIPTRLALENNPSEEDIETAKIVAQKVEDALIASGVQMNRPLTTAEALWMLYRANNAGSDLLSEAQKAVVADNLGFSKRAKAQKQQNESDVRFRQAEEAEIDSLVNVYNQSASYWKSRLYEVFVDQYDSVDGLVRAIEDASGKKAQSFEDPRYALNQMPAKSGTKSLQMTKKYVFPMWDAIKKLIEKYDLTEAKIARYTKLKHGLERNEEFPRRDARAFYQNAYDKKVAAIDADESLSAAEKAAEKRKAKDELDFHFTSIKSGADAKFQEFREKDYSGIMAMYDDTYDNLYDAERKAKEEIESFEAGKKAEIEELWKTINALNKATLKIQYESGQLSKTTYEMLKEQFKYYVPLRGFEKETAEDQFNYYSREFSSFEAAVLKAKGRKTEAESPFGHMGAMMASAIVAGEKNAAKLALYYFALNRKDNGLLTIKDVWYVKREDSDAWELSFPPVKAEGESIADYGQRMDAWEERMKNLQSEGKAKKGKQSLKLNDIVHIENSSEKEHYIRVQVAGQEKWMIVNGNPRAAQAINGLLNLESDPYFNKFFGKLMRELAQLSTSYNPEFWMTNLERDLMTTFATVAISEDAEYRKAFFKNYKKAWQVIKLLPKLKDGTLGDAGIEGILKEAVAGGLQTGFSHIKANEVWDKEMEQHFKDVDAGKAKQAVMAVFDKLQNISESMELVSRFAVYMTSREMGKSVSEAVADGKEVTANFNRKGSGRAISFEEAKKLTTKSGKTFREEYGENKGAVAEALIVSVSKFAEFGRKYILFFNASIQGLDKWFRLANKKKGNAGKLAAYFGGQFALGLLVSMLYGMLDDDEYQENIGDYDRRNNLMIGGNGHYIKVALPHDVRAFYGMGDIFYNYISGNYKHHDWKDIAKTVGKQTGSIAPVNPFNGWAEFVPAFMKPVIEAGAPMGAMGIEGTNKNFAGMPIRKETPWLTDEELERTPKYTLAGDYTWDWLVDVAEALNSVTGGTYKEKGKINIDPARIQHYIEGWTGGVGRTTGNFATFIGQLIGEDEWKAANTPFLNKILTITDERSQNKLSNSQFYHYKDIGEAALSRAKTYQKDGENELLVKERQSDEYKIGLIYRKYKKAEETYRKQLKVARDEAEEKRIKELRDANRKRFLDELNRLDLL